MTLGQRLYEMRRIKGLSQENVAERLGVTRQTVSKWETDQTTPDFDKILPLCELYDVSTDALLKGKEESEQSDSDTISNNSSNNNNDSYSNTDNTNKYNDYYEQQNTDTFTPGTANTAGIDELQAKHKKIFAALLSTSVFLYILSVVPFFFMKGEAALVTFFIFIAVATMLIVFGTLSKPKAQQQSVVHTKEDKLYKQITSIIASIVLIIYLLVSFLTKAWHISWIIWIVYAVICEIIKLLFMLRGVEINDKE